MLTAPVTAQQNLSDVAGSIKLKKPEGESVVIDHRTVGTVKKSTQKGTDGELLLVATNRCWEISQTLISLLGETGSGKVFYDDGWRVRVETAGTAFDEAREDLEYSPVPDRFSEAYREAQSGVLASAQALEVLRSAIANDRPQFTQAKTQFAGGSFALNDAMTQMRAVLRVEESEVAPPGVDPLTATRSVASLCGGWFEQGSDDYTRCVAQQRAALDAINSRFSFNVGLGEAAFNTVRNGCLSEFPKDFVRRDSCERRRIETAK
jgi:hypothetical protein